MEKRYANCSLFILLLIIIISGIGCTSLRYKNMAETFATENKWDYAVENYEKALKKSLFKKKAQKRVRQAREDAAYYYYHESLYLLKHKKMFLAEQKKAFEMIEKSIFYSPENKTYSGVRANIAESINNLESRIKECFRKLHDSISDYHYLDAFRQSEEILYIDPVNKEAKKIEKMIRKKGSSFYYKYAQKKEKNRAFEAAIQYYEYSNILKKSEKTADAIKRVQNKQKAVELYKSISDLSGEKEDERISKALKTMVVLDSMNRDYRNILIKSLFRKIALQVKREEYKEAIDTVLELETVSDRKKSVMRGLKKIKKRLVSDIYNSAITDIKNNYPGNALETLVWLNHRNYLDKGGHDLLESTMTKVLQRAVPEIHLSEFSTFSDNDNSAATIVSDELFKYLYKAGNVKAVVIRENVDENNDTLHLKFKVPVTDLTDYVALLDGTNLKLSGRILSRSFNHIVSEKNVTKRYISHYEKELNPAYVKWMNDDDPGIDLPKTKNDGLNTFFSIIEITSVVIDSIPPKKYIEKPVYTFHKYIVETHNIEAMVEFTVYLSDRNTGRLLFKKEFQEKMNVSDTYVPGNIEAGVPGDPMALASDEILKRDFLVKSSEKAAHEVVSFLYEVPELLRQKAKKEIEMENLKRAKEYSVFAVVAEAPLNALADAFWPQTPENDLVLIQENERVVVQKTGSVVPLFKNGDTLLKINGISVKSLQKAKEILSCFGKKSLVSVTVKRANKRTESFLTFNPYDRQSHMKMVQ